MPKTENISNYIIAYTRTPVYKKKKLYNIVAFLSVLYSTLKFITKYIIM